MFNFKYVAAAAALLLASSAFAGGPDIAPEPVTHNFYVNGQGGVSILSHYHPFYAAGWNLSGALGYRWENIRVELQGQYTQHTVATNWQNPTLFVLNGGGTATFNDLQTLNVFVNAYYDFDYWGAFIPYLGAGIGWQNIWNHVVIGNNTNPLVNRWWSLSRNRVTGQAIAGIDFAVTDTLRVGLSYHAVLAAAPYYSRLIHVNVWNNHWFNRNCGLDSQINLGVTLFF